MTKERRLGRGLAALLGGDGELPAGAETATGPRLHRVADDASPADRPTADRPTADGELLQLNVYEIDNNPFQPRKQFSPSEIAALAESLKEHDMLSPVLVRRVGERYQLISGERRLRAAIQAGWTTIPARLREADDRLVAELAIVENLQRKDLNPLEKALSFQRYLQQHGGTQDELAQRLKIDRTTVTNLLRLLELPPPVQESLALGEISAGHARALLPLGDEAAQVAFGRRIVDEGLSVRETERQVTEHIELEDSNVLASSVGPARPATSTPQGARSARTGSDHVASLEQELRRALGAKVDIRQTARGRGRIIVHFKNHDDFERLREHLCDTGARPAAQAG